MHAEWFTNPHLPGPTPFTILEDGRVYGHLCLWQSCHLSYAHECVQPPHHFRGQGKLCDVCNRDAREANHSKGKYRYFTLGELRTPQGLSVDVGQVTFKTGHAPIRVGSKAATAHYDHTGTCGADVRAGEDAYGCWLAGSVRSLDDDCLREFQGAKLSGDWRQIGGHLELVGILSVNVPGFPVPRARVAAAPHPHALALVAGAMPVDTSALDRQRMRQLRRDSGIEMAQLRRTIR